MATATGTKKTSRTQSKAARPKSGDRNAAGGARARATSRSRNGKSAGAAKTGARKPAARKPAARKAGSSRAATAAPASRTASRAGKRSPRAGKVSSSRSGASARAAATQGDVTAPNGSSSESSMPVKMAKSALAGLAGSVAIGVATRAASRRSHRTRVLGVVIPKQLKPENLASAIDVKKLSGKVDYGNLLKRIGDAAEVIEARSDEVRTLSGQAKRLSRKLA